MLRVALAQINPIVGNLEGNYYKIAANIWKARTIASDLIVFPELALTGYPPEDLLYKKQFIKDNLKFLKKLTRDTTNITAIVGFVDQDKHGRLYNAAAVIHDQKIKGVYHKQILPNYGVFDEKRYFSEGSKSQIYTIAGVPVGISICEDIWSMDGPCKEQVKYGAKLLINISSSPFYAGKINEREKILKQQARKMGVHVCYANLVGGQDELVFDGGSMIVNQKGKVMASGVQFKEDMVVKDLDIAPRRKTFSKKVKRIMVSSKKEKDSRLTIRGYKAPRMGSGEEILKALQLGTYDYVRKNGFKKVVIGLSGGIDSSVVACIAAGALGANNVIGITMPSQFSSEGTRSDAKKLAANLGIKCLEIPIRGIYDGYMESFTMDFVKTRPSLAEENLQARIRGDILMSYSNKFGWLVLTTGNKSEVAVGYCTLYGDMSGGFAVIKDVPKTLVYQLARVINKKNRGLIPESVIKRAPTAELKLNQKDADSLPRYERLDPILKDYVEGHLSYQDIRRKKRQSPKMVEKVISLVDRSEYKRRQSPPGIKITPRAFGKDWRLPITNKYRQFD